MLLEIWYEYHNKDEVTPFNRLPEPPGVRERLVQEIRFLVSNLQEKLSSLGQ